METYNIKKVKELMKEYETLIRQTQMEVQAIRFLNSEIVSTKPKLTLVKS